MNSAPASSRRDPYAAARRRMVRDQVAQRGVYSEAVLAAMRTVPRHRFVQAEQQAEAYADHPLALGPGQSISQPYIVALMTELADAEGASRVLEIGTGSGYQAAVLAELCGHVYTIEQDPGLAQRAEATLRGLRYENVSVRHADGRLGWPEAAPFDAVLVTAVTDSVPPALIEQLAPGGRLVIPQRLDAERQVLRVGRRAPDGSLALQDVTPVRFVPLQ